MFGLTDKRQLDVVMNFFMRGEGNMATSIAARPALSRQLQVELHVRKRSPARSMTMEGFEICAHSAIIRKSGMVALIEQARNASENNSRWK